MIKITKQRKNQFCFISISILVLSCSQLKEKDPLKEKLTKLQYDVTQNCSTEPPFQNEFCDNKEVGCIKIRFV